MTTTTINEYQLRNGSGGGATFTSFAEAVAATTLGNTRTTSSYHSDMPGFGGATYVKTTDTGVVGETDGGGYFIGTDGFKWILQDNGAVYISQFGARPDNGVTDNRASMQASINYATANRCKWIVDQTNDVGDGVTDPDYFGLNSFHPDYPEGHCLVFTSSRQMQIEGNRTRSSNIRYVGSTAGKSVVFFSNPVGFADWGYIVERLGVSATATESDQVSCVLEHCVYARNDRPLARCKFRDNTFSGGTEAVFLGSFYLSEFTGNEWRYGIKDGFALGGDTRYALTAGEVTTSISYTNNWARLCGQYGHRVYNQLWYSNFEANACDSLGSSGTGSTNRIQVGYYFGNLRGVGFYNNGAEGVDKIFRCADAQEVTIDNFWSSSCGPTDGSTTLYAYELASGGTNVKLSGMTTEIEGRFDYTLGVTNPSGSMLVQILDASVTSDEVFVNTATAGTFTNYVRWPNNTDVGGMRAQKRTGNVIWPDTDINIIPAQGYSSTQVAMRIGSISGVAAATAIPILKTTGGTLASTIYIKYIMNKLDTAVAQVYEGVVRLKSDGTRNVQYFTKLSGNATSVPTLAWNGVTLELVTNETNAQCIVEAMFHSRNSIGVEFLL